MTLLCYTEWRNVIKINTERLTIKMKQTDKKLTTYQMITCALMAAIMCILGPISIQIGPVPISQTMVAVFLAVFVLGTKFGCLSYVIYYLLGLVGLPVFSGGAGGLGKVAGPTGGYLIGMFFMALIVGLFLKKFPNRWYMILVGMIVGDAVNYVFGTAWFVISTQSTVQYALEVCVLPFILVDLIKMVFSLIVGMAVRRQLIKAGLAS